MEQAEDCGSQTGRAMSNTAQRIPIHAGDPDEVFVVEAELLTQYATLIERDVADILAKFPGSTAGWAAYVDTLGSDIPDDTIKAAVKRLAVSKIRQAGVAI
jgi:hypothetical protein